MYWGTGQNYNQHQTQNERKRYIKQKIVQLHFF